MQRKEDYATLRSYATRLVTAGLEEQRRLVAEDLPFITAISHWKPTKSDSALYNRVSAIIQSVWFAGTESASAVEATDSNEDGENDETSEATMEVEDPWQDLDITTWFRSITALTGQLEELNSALEMAPALISSVDRLSSALDSAEAAATAPDLGGIAERPGHILETAPGTIPGVSHVPDARYRNSPAESFLHSSPQSGSGRSPGMNRMSRESGVLREGVGRPSPSA